MPASDYMELQVLGHLFGETTWTKPTALYVAALTATPEDTGGMVEVSAAEYARLQYDPSDSNWLSQTDGSRINAAALSFAEPTTDWGTVTAVALFDAETGGNLMAYQLLDSAKTLTAGGPLLMFQPGALSWKMNNY